MSDSKKPPADLTNLSILTKTSDQEKDAAEFSITSDSGASNLLEGLDDLLAPMSPTHADEASGEEPTLAPDLNLNPDADAYSNDLPTPSPAGAFDDLDAIPTLDSSVEEPVSLEEPSSVAATAVGATIAAKLSTPMEEVREYSNTIAPSAGPAIAGTPFSLLIDGPLKTHEREALLQILARENLGIREVELEPQFEAGRILIPRVSEFVGVLIVQTLRNAQVRMRLGPSEKIYVSQSADDEDRLIFHPESESELLLTEEGEHPADRIILSPDAEIQGRNILEALDTLHSSMNLKASQIAHPQSPLFQDAIEKLKRQLKLQAHHRGANALVSFSYTLHPLEGQTVYKLVVQASAVRI